MSEGLSNEQPPEDVSDLLALMDDPSMVAAMRRAADQVKCERERAGLSLIGEEGKKNAEKLQLIAAGLLDVRDAGPGFYRDSDGVLGIKLDEESQEAFRRTLGLKW